MKDKNKIELEKVGLFTTNGEVIWVNAMVTDVISIGKITSELRYIERVGTVSRLESAGEVYIRFHKELFTAPEYVDVSGLDSTDLDSLVSRIQNKKELFWLEMVYSDGEVETIFLPYFGVPINEQEEINACVWFEEDRLDSNFYELRLESGKTYPIELNDKGGEEDEMD